MIRGWFDPEDKFPYVKGRVHFPRLRVMWDIEFLVDTGAETTVAV